MKVGDIKSSLFDGMKPKLLLRTDDPGLFVSVDISVAQIKKSFKFAGLMNELEIPGIECVDGNLAIYSDAFPGKHLTE